MSVAPTTPAVSQPQQLALPGAEELFAAVGLESLPHGAGELSVKQLKFAIAFLGCGNERQAARESGYAEQHASKVMQRGALARFVAAAVKPVAQNGDQLVRRKWELSVSLHHELMELRGKEQKTKTSADLKRERQLIRMANQTDMLLAALLNRLGIKLTGEISHNHTASGGDFVVLPPDSLAGFAAMRQEVAAATRLQSAGGPN